MRSFLDWCGRFWRDDSGVVMLETALVFPLQLLITLLLMQMAMIWSAANVVRYAAFQAARTAVVHIKGQGVTEDVRWRAFEAAHVVTSSLSNPATSQSPNVAELRTMHHMYYMKRTPLSGLDVRVGFDQAFASVGDIDDTVVTADIRLYFPLTVPLAGSLIGSLASGSRRSSTGSGMWYLPMNQMVSLPRPWPN